MPEEGNVKQAVPKPEKTLFAWQAFARPYRQKSRNYFVTVFAIAGVVGLVLFLAEGSMPAILLASLVFLFYVLNTVRPETIEYSLTDRGIKIAGSTTDWAFLTRFWFAERQGVEMLMLETLRVPGRLELVINREDKEKIRKILSEYLNEEEVPPSHFERMARWVSSKLPQE